MRRVRARAFGAVLALMAATVAPQAIAQPAAPAASAQTPHDLNGVWQLSGGASRGFKQSEWTGEPLPFTEKGRQAFNANIPGKGPRLVPAARGNDPIGGANPPGLYRTLIYPRPFEFIQLKDQVVQAFELSRVWRSISTDGRPVPKEIPEGPFWYGYSVGEWQGDTLVVHVLSVDERAWMDEWGTPFSAGATFEERWRRVAPDQIQMTVTVNDPTYYTRPWTSAPMTFRLQKKGVEPEEIIFAPVDEAAFNADIRNPAGQLKK